MRLLPSLAAMLCLIAAVPASTQELPLSPQSLTVSEFLTRFAAIKREKDKAAGDGTRLASAVGESVKRYKLELDAQKQAGTRPRACPRKGSKDSFSFDALAAELLKLPDVEREGPFEAAFFAFLDKRHPCPSA